MVVALGTDFNPNAHCLSMPMVMHLACVNLRMTLNEVKFERDMSGKLHSENYCEMQMMIISRSINMHSKLYYGQMHKIHNHDVLIIF